MIQFNHILLIFKCKVCKCLVLLCDGLTEANLMKCDVEKSHTELAHRLLFIRDRLDYFIDFVSALATAGRSMLLNIFRMKTSSTEFRLLLLKEWARSHTFYI